MTEDRTAGVTWDAPGPGTWGLDRVHVPKPASQVFQDVSGALSAGFGEAAARYGFPFATMKLGFVNGFMYTQAQPLDPSEFAARIERAEKAFADRLWLSDTERWDREVKPAALVAHRKVIDVDPGDADDAALAAHLRTCFDHYWAMWVQHHQFNGTHWLPVGDFILFAHESTGVRKSRLAQLLSGAAPASRGDCPELTAVVDAVQSTPEAAAVLRDATAADAGRAIDALRNIGATARAVEAWLHVVGYRLVDGFDVLYPYALERPELLIAGLRNALQRGADDDARQKHLEDLLLDVRSHVDGARLNEFDERYADARHCFHVRDERGIYSDAVAAGLMRRAMLTAGRRLAGRDILRDPALALDASIDELCALLDAASVADAADIVKELESRSSRRERLRLTDAPMFVGDMGDPPPSPDMMPPPLARVFGAIRSTFDEDSAERPTAPDANTLVGAPASPGVHRGTARVLHSADDFDRLQDGDVLVAVTTGEAFNVAIAVVSALVTDQGGIMSHAGITSREFGIPAVVGVAGATATIPDGATVVVDGDTGTVTWE